MQEGGYVRVISESTVETGMQWQKRLRGNRKEDLNEDLAAERAVPRVVVETRLAE